MFNRRRAAAQNSEADGSGFEEQCNYCPQCGEAYRAEIEHCAACSVRLISGSEKLTLEGRRESAPSPHAMEISADDELVAIQHGKLGQLKPLQQLLKADHVPSILGGGAPSRG